MTILVTGASGFVGSAMCRLLRQRGSSVRCAMRQPGQGDRDSVAMPDLDGNAQWGNILNNIDTVVHTAARVHVMRDTVSDPLTEFRKINTAGTLTLARQAAAAGVRRFVFVSTIKVNGEQTFPGNPFVADAPPMPSDPYSISKYEAELGLKAVAETTGMEVTIVRPPLIYGPGVQANFLNMMRWLARGIPLPLGAIHNRRSLVALDNLVDLLAVCISQPAAANRTFLASDGEDLSTTELLRRLAHAMGKPARLIPVPAALLALGGAVAGRRDIAQRLCASLQIDLSQTQTTLSWSPVIDVDSALQKTAHYFLSCSGI